MKPHQLSGGGKSTRFTSSRGIPFKPGASVGRGDTPAIATRPMGVGMGMGPSHGMAIEIRTSRDAYKTALLVCIVAGVDAQQDGCG